MPLDKAGVLAAFHSLNSSNSIAQPAANGQGDDWAGAEANAEGLRDLNLLRGEVSIQTLPTTPAFLRDQT